MSDLCFSKLINKMHFPLYNSVYVESRQLVRSYKLWKVFSRSYHFNSIELDWIVGNKAYGADAGIWTQALLVIGDYSHYCATFGLHKTAEKITITGNVKNNKAPLCYWSVRRSFGSGALTIILLKGLYSKRGP